MRKLILHLGSHKTGTTSVQKWLYNNQNSLLEKGIGCFFSAPNIDDKVSINATNWFDQNKIDTYGASIRKGLDKALSMQSGKSVLMSSEVFSWIFDKNEIMNFKNQLNNYFDEIKLVVYLRRQDKMAISHYQQAAKTYHVDGKFYKGAFGALPTLDDNAIKYLDYYSHYTRWADIFGDDNIDFRIFEKEKLVGGDIILDFLDYLSIYAKDINIKSVSTNISYSFSQIKVNHLMRESGMSHREKLTHKITKSLHTSEKMTPSLDEAQQFYNHFTESNKKLNERFNIEQTPDIFDNNFAMYSKTGNQYWNEKSANDAILNILKVIKSNNMIGIGNIHNEKKVIDILRDMAIQVESFNVSLSNELMKVAYRLRPSGTFLKKKIKEYENLLSNEPLANSSKREL